MNRNDTYKSEFFIAELLEWPDLQGYGIEAIAPDHAYDDDVGFTVGEFLSEYAADYVGGQWSDGVLTLPLGTDIVAELTVLDLAYEELCAEFFAELKA